jgi:TPR repeat protein
MLRTERAWVDDIWDKEPDLKRLHEAWKLLDNDLPTAVAKLRLLADLGSIKSMVYLGTIYRTDVRIEKDLSEAEKWYLRAAQLDYIPATYGLGLIYLKRKYYRRAVEEFKRGAARNYMASIYMLGEMFYRGQGVAADVNKARELWERGNLFGYLYAKDALGKLLMTGKFGPLQWLRGMWLEHQAVVLGFIYQWKDPRDPRL